MIKKTKTILKLEDQRKIKSSFSQKLIQAIKLFIKFLYNTQVRKKF